MIHEKIKVTIKIGNLFIIHFMLVKKITEIFAKYQNMYVDYSGKFLANVRPQKPEQPKVFKVNSVQL